MKYIPRALKETVKERLNTDRRIVLLLGPRQVCKTTLAQELMREVAGQNFLQLSGEDPRTAELVSSCDLSRLRGVFQVTPMGCWTKGSTSRMCEPPLGTSQKWIPGYW